MLVRTQHVPKVASATSSAVTCWRSGRTERNEATTERSERGGCGLKSVRQWGQSLFQSSHLISVSLHSICSSHFAIMHETLDNYHVPTRANPQCNGPFWWWKKWVSWLSRYPRWKCWWLVFFVCFASLSFSVPHISPSLWWTLPARLTLGDRWSLIMSLSGPWLRAKVEISFFFFFADR